MGWAAPPVEESWDSEDEEEEAVEAEGAQADGAVERAEQWTAGFGCPLVYFRWCGASYVLCGSLCFVQLRRLYSVLFPFFVLCVCDLFYCLAEGGMRVLPLSPPSTRAGLK